jgi:MFS transporter, PPP family, 3-phenylpropionic acid transporter
MLRQAGINDQLSRVGCAGHPAFAIALIKEISALIGRSRLSASHPQPSLSRGRCAHVAESCRALPRFLALYSALYAAFGVHSPFFPALLEDRGLQPESIGMALAAGTAVRLIAGPTAGRLADRFNAPKAILTACLIAAALIGLLYLRAQGLWLLLAVAVAHATALAPLAPLTDTLALGTAASSPRRETSERQLDYGWLRGAGSAAFVLGSLLSGHAIGHLGIGAIVLLNAALLGAAALCALCVPILLPGRPPSPPLSLASVDGSDLWALFRIPMFRRVLLVAALVLGSHALHDSFIVIRWGAVGIGPQTAGLLWSEQVVAEVLIFLFLGRPILNRLGPGRALALAAAAGVVRWAVLAETAWLPAMAIVEPLHGFTFALLHLASMRLLAEIVPPRHAATALALYGTVAIGAATALVTLLSGPLYAQLGASAFWVMGAVCAAALPIALGAPARHS